METATNQIFLDKNCESDDKFDNEFDNRSDNKYNDKSNDKSNNKFDNKTFVFFKAFKQKNIIIYSINYVRTKLVRILNGKVVVLKQR